MRGKDGKMGPDQVREKIDVSDPRLRIYLRLGLYIGHDKGMSVRVV